MTQLNPTPNAGSPRPVRHAPARPFIVIGSGVLAAVLLIVVVLNMRTTPGAAQQQNDASTPVDIEVFGPSGLTDEDLATAGAQPGRDVRLNLPSGGWIQVPNEKGGVAQQYKFTRLEPDPPGYSAGWVQMEGPVAEIYVADDRVLHLQGDEATMFVPNRALESGTMTGNVTIRLFESQPNQQIDPAVDAPSLLVRTNEASFNNILGELRCSGSVHVETPDSEFPGENLTLLLNDRDQMIQSMTVERGEFIRITGNKAREAEDDARRGTDDDTPPPGTAPPPPTLASSPHSPAPSAAKAEPFYRLTLHDNVRIEQDGEELARGDSLVVTFSFRSKGMGSAMAFLPTLKDGADALPTAIALSLTQHIAAAAIATLQAEPLALSPPPSGDDLYVYWDGPLTMEPVTDPAQRLASTSDARMELFGSPLTLTDETGWNTVSCAALAYHTQGRKPFLIASEEFPGVLVRSDPELRAAAQDAGAEPVEELRITWGKSLKLDFYDSPDGSSKNRLRRAKFVEDVQVLTPDVDFRGDEMVVDFFEAQAERDAIKAVLATGSVTALRPGATPDEMSKLVTRELLVEFALRDDETSYPRHIRATGDVEAMDAEETMWADVVDVLLRERTPEEQSQVEAKLVVNDEDEPNGIAGLEWGEGRLGGTELEKLTAENDVQLLLEGGTRVWADTLNVDGVNRSITLTGADEDILIASGNHIVDRGKHIHLREVNEFERQVMMEDSPGVFIQMSGPVLPMVERRRIERPEIKDPPQVSVRWTERMQYDENTIEKTSEIEFHGQVDGRSEPSALERSTVTADSLRLEFIEKLADNRAPDAGAAAPAEDDHEDDANALGDRTINRLHAAGEAKIESRTWEKEDRSDTPRVFYIAGDAINYDDVALNASVTGKGALLMRDERPKQDAGAAEDAPDAAPAGPFDEQAFGSRGTTLFRFTEGMRMQQQMENRFLAQFQGDVEWLHKALDGRTATMTGQHLEAVISRRSKPEEGVDLDFGGAAQLERITGRGGVVIRSSAYDYVQCEEFIYDPATGIAELSAAPGRTIAVLAHDAPRPFHAERIHWDMNADKMRIIRGAMDR
jgi:hypothetical protein